MLNIIGTIQPSVFSFENQTVKKSKKENYLRVVSNETQWVLSIWTFKAPKHEHMNCQFFQVWHSCVPIYSHGRCCPPNFPISMSSASIFCPPHIAIAARKSSALGSVMTIGQWPQFRASLSLTLSALLLKPPSFCIFGPFPQRLLECIRPYIAAEPFFLLPSRPYFLGTGAEGKS